MEKSSILNEFLSHEPLVSGHVADLDFRIRCRNCQEIIDVTQMYIIRGELGYEHLGRCPAQTA